MNDVTLCFITFIVSSRNSADLVMNPPLITYNFIPISRWEEKWSPLDRGNIKCWSFVYIYIYIYTVYYTNEV